MNVNTLERYKTLIDTGFLKLFSKFCCVNDMG